jgi:hypothetical protein
MRSQASSGETAANGPFSMDHNPSEPIAASQAMTVEGLELRVLPWLPQDDAYVAVTAGAIAG